MSLFKKIALTVAAAVVVPLSLVGCGSGEINDWSTDCIELGGIPAKTHTGFLYERYECFVDGKIVTVPGYAGE